MPGAGNTNIEKIQSHPKRTPVGTVVSVNRAVRGSSGGVKMFLRIEIVTENSQMLQMAVKGPGYKNTGSMCVVLWLQTGVCGIRGQ